MPRDEGDLTGLSKFLSLLLRHKPAVLNLEMNNNGYVHLNEICQKMQKRKRWNWVEQKTIEKVVRNDPKGRFEVKEKNGDKYIRATYGHNKDLPISITYEELKANRRVLYHGTKKRFLKNILQKGLKPKSRKYVHLSANKKDALNVAERRQGENVLLKIKVRELRQSGRKIFKATNKLFLCKHVPPEVIEVVSGTSVGT